MVNQFEEDYQIVSAINDEGYDAWYSKTIALRGKYYIKIFWLYYDSRKVKNTFIDISDRIMDQEAIREMISVMREYGIRHFTFSSGWSRSVEDAWLFQQEGCTVEKLVEINGRWDSLEEAYTKLPAYLFKVN